MNGIESIGWALQLSPSLDCDTGSAGGEDGTHTYVLNIIRPVVNIPEPLEPEKLSEWVTHRHKGVIPTGSDVITQFDSLMFPWMWEEVEWGLWSRPEGMKWSEVPGDNKHTIEIHTGTYEADGDDKSILQDAVRAEIEQSVSDCQVPFSGNPDDFIADNEPVNGRQPLTFSITPFTHLAAPVSNEVLKLAGFISLEKETADSLEGMELAAFPGKFLFKADGNRGECKLKSLKGHDDLPGYVVAEYSLTRDPWDVASREIKFITKTAQGPGAGQACEVSLANSSAGDHDWRSSAVREFAGRSLHPAHIIARYVFAYAQGIDSQDSRTSQESPVISATRWKWLLVQALGLGWERDRIEVDPVDPVLEEDEYKPNHLFDNYISSKEFGKLFPDANRIFNLETSGPGEGPHKTRLDDEQVLALLDSFERHVSAHAANVAGTDPITAWYRSRGIDAAHPLPDWIGQLARKDTYKDLTIWARIVVSFFDAESGRDLQLMWWMFLVDRFADTSSVLAELKNKLITRLIDDTGERQCMLSLAGSMEKIPLAGEAESGTARYWQRIEAYDGQDAAEELLKCRIRELLDVELADLPFPVENPDSENLFKNAVSQAVDGFHRGVRESRPQRVKPKDDGLEISLAGADNAKSDTEIRGFAVALWPGIPHQGDDDSAYKECEEYAAWITGTGIKIPGNEFLSTCRGSNQDCDGGKDFFTTDTVGSSESGGQRIVRIEYDGRPVCALLKDEKLLDEEGDDADGVASVEYRWPNGPSTPPLGYGLHYRALQAVIDNAGGVHPPGLRKNGMEATLKDAKEIDLGSYTRRLEPYLSWQPPGAPYLANDSQGGFPSQEDMALSAQTRAAQYRRDKAQDLRDKGEGEVDLKSKVAVLVPSTGNEYYRKGKSEFSLMLVAPGADADFIERWLETDILLKEINSSEGEGGGNHYELSHSIFEDIDVNRETIKECQNHFNTQLRVKTHDQTYKNLKDLRALYHPAVTALGVDVEWWEGGNEYKVSWAYRTERLVKEGNKLRPPVNGQTEITIRASGKCEFDKDDGVLLLAPGCFAVIRLYTLVEERFFEEGKITQRYHHGLRQVKPDNELNWRLADGTSTPKYRSFGFNEQWFEVLPDTLGDVPLKDSTFRVQLPNRDRPDLTSLHLCKLHKDVSLPADWIQGFTWTRHEWHWTGYPVRFPWQGTAGVRDWITSFAGIESDVDTRTSVAASKLMPNGDWVLPEDQAIGRPRELRRGSRPAGYVAYTVRPRVRYREWLKPESDPMKLESKVHAVGGIEMGYVGVGADFSLPVPVLIESIPLTASYRESSGLLPARTVNGNLLIFDHAIYDTSRSAPVGGISDMIEIDLMQTRSIVIPNDKDRAENSDRGDGRGREDIRTVAFSEIGVNPIFHQALTTEEQTRLDVRASVPFGLTYDLVKNALVNQTAVMVSPVSGHGKWLMAKVRARRLLLPETLLFNERAGKDKTSERSTSRIFRIPVRKIGEEIQPGDFVLDFENYSQDEKVVIEVDGCECHLELPVNLSGECRLQITWHRGRFNNDNPEVVCKPQVRGQKRESSQGNWELVEGGKVPIFSQCSWYGAIAEMQDGSLKMELRTKSGWLPEVTCRSLHASDYTEPQWITFIGSFETESPGRSDEYRIIAVDKGGELQLFGPKLPGMTAMEECLEGGLEDGARSGDVTFQLLHIYKPIHSIMQGSVDHTAGAQIAVYRYIQDAHVEIGNGSELASIFEPFGDNPELDDEGGYYAYIMSYHRISARQCDEKNSHIGCSNWGNLLDLIFPEDENTESTIRPIPEYIGPIRIVSE